MCVLMFCIFVLFMFVVLFVCVFEINVSVVWVYDVLIGIVLMEKNFDQLLFLVFMLKLMMLNMLFEVLYDGCVIMDMIFFVLIKVWKMGGFKMFVEFVDWFLVEELIYGIIINFGNDVCVVVVEGLVGIEEVFVWLMIECVL